MYKVTNKVALTIAASALADHPELTGYYDTQEVVDKLKSMIAQLDKKANAERKPTKAQREAEPIKEAILKVLACGEWLTVSDIQERDEALVPAIVSNQRVSSLLRVMIDESKVIKDVQGRKAKYHLA